LPQRYAFLRLDVGDEVGSDQVPVVVVHDGADHSHQKVPFPEGAQPDGLDHLFELGRRVVLGAGGGHPAAQFVDRVDPGAEDEDVLVADFLVDLHVGAVHGADDHPAVHHELHVAGPRGLGARGRDVLAELGGGDDDLGVGDAVVGQEDDLEQAFGLVVVVEDVGDFVDELDDVFGGDVAGG